MAQLFANAARSTLTASITSTSTQLQINPADQALFPVATGADWFKVALEDSSGNLEFMQVQRAVGQSLLTILARATEDAAKFPARAFVAGSLVELRMTAADLAASIAHPGIATGAHPASAIAVTPVGAIASTNMQAALQELDSEKADSAATASALGGKVSLTGAETIAGVKTFAAQPVLPGDATTALQAVPKQQLDAAFPPGWIAAMARLTAPAGWLLIDGKTIGNAASGATSRANSDTVALYAELWAFPAASVPIYDNTGAASTRGASAAADFAAGKRLPLFTPDGGAFLRMWAPGQSRDAGRAAGSVQEQQTPDHTHAQRGLITTGSGTGGGGVFMGGDFESVSTTGARGVAVGTVGASNHPYNLSMPHYIKL